MERTARAMTEEQELEAILQRIPDIGLRTDAREFSLMSQTAQMVHLFLGLHELRNNPPNTPLKATIAAAGGTWAGILGFIGWLIAGQPRP